MDKSGQDASKWVCSDCVQESYLQNMIQQQRAGTCSYCSKRKVPRMDVLTLSELVEQALETHFERTADEPTVYEYAMLRDKESDYNWDRTGEPVVEVIGEILECDEEIAKDVQSILSEKHDRYSPGDGYDGECEFSSESHYELKKASTSAWVERWNRLEHSLKHESRLFNQEVLELFQSVFAGLDTARSFSRDLAIVKAGPGCEIDGLYRAREFQSPESLQDALQRPVEALGPPPGRTARANRMNSSGVSVFYGAREEKSALAEVRPVVGSKVVVAKFDIVRSLQLLDLRTLERLRCHGSYFDPDYSTELERYGFLRSLSRRLVLPVMPNEQDHAYLITQAVADYLSTVQAPSIDGIIFPSVQDGVGVNVVLFHKASHVEALDFPTDTRFSAEVEDFDYDTGRSYPSYWLQVDKPTEPAATSSRVHPNVFKWDWDTYYARNREPALRLDLKAITVHAIKAVEIKVEVQEVHVSYGTYSKDEDGSSHRF